MRLTTYYVDVLISLVHNPLTIFVHSHKNQSIHDLQSVQFELIKQY